LTDSFSLRTLRSSSVLRLRSAALFLRCCFLLASSALLSTILTPLLAFELPHLASSFFITFGRLVRKRCRPLISLLILAGLRCHQVCLLARFTVLLGLRDRRLTIVFKL
jgi:hypothetical protein